jgi:hypothetical protein
MCGETRFALMKQIYFGKTFVSRPKVLHKNISLRKLEKKFAKNMKMHEEICALPQ